MVTGWTSTLSWLWLNLASQARILSPRPGSAKLAAAKVMTCLPGAGASAAWVAMDAKATSEVAAARLMAAILCFIRVSCCSRSQRVRNQLTHDSMLTISANR